MFWRQNIVTSIPSICTIHRKTEEERELEEPSSSSSLGRPFELHKLQFLRLQSYCKELDYEIRSVFLKICVFDGVVGDTGKYGV